MDTQTARILAQTTTELYERCADSFSQTREKPWQGWDELAQVFIEPLMAKHPTGLRVLDVAAGNLRFGRFLEGAFLPSTCGNYHAIDGCRALLEAHEPMRLSTRVEERDLLTPLIEGTATAIAPACSYDLVCCFGFFHHIPGRERRERFLCLLSDAVAPGGILALSLWRFLDDGRLSRKAERDHKRGVRILGTRTGLDCRALEPGDRLLAWKDEAELFRYCHSFSDEEVRTLVETLDGALSLLGRFRADGPSGRLNEYLVFGRKEDS